MPFVYDFDHSHRRPPMELKDLLGGKGANLAEMTSVLRLPGAPRLHHHHRRLPGLHGRRVARRAVGRGQAGPGPAREEDGQAPRRPRRPAARERPVGGQVLHARDDGHGPQPRAQRRVGAGPGQADRRRALRLRLLPAVRVDVRAHRARHPRRGLRHPARRGQGALGGRHRRRCPGGAAPCARLRLQADRQRPHRRGLPPGPRRAAAGRHRGRVRLLERAARHRLSRPRGHRPRPRHGRQRPGHGVRQPRRPVRDRRRLHPRPGHRRQGRVRRLPRQRPGRGRGGRDPQHRAPVRAEGQVPQDPRRAPGHLRPPRAPLPRHVRHRVHHRAGQAVDAADPGAASARAGPRCAWRWR